MAKKKEEPVEEVGTNYTERLLAEFSEAYGKNIMLNCDQFMDMEEVIIPLSPNLDNIIGGGVRDGSWVSVSGPPKVGKTVTLLSLAAECQKPENGSMHVYYIKAEGRLNKRDLRGIRGLNLDKEHFTIICSEEEKILTAQDFLNIAIRILNTHPRCFLLFDSISALCDSREQEGGVGTETRGGGQKLVSQFIRICCQLVPIKRSIVAGVVQLIADTSGRTQGKIENAASKWTYQADYRLRANYAEAWRTGGEDSPQIGQIVHWTCNASPLSPPGMKCESYLRYGVGVDKIYETFDVAKVAKLIDVSGAWYTLSFMKNHPELRMEPGKTPEDPPKEKPWNEKDFKFQGAQKVYQALQNNPAWCAAMQNDVRKFIKGEA